MAVAAQVQPLAWELPYDAGAAVKRKKKKIIVHYKGTLTVHFSMRADLASAMVSFRERTEQARDYGCSVTGRYL